MIYVFRSETSKLNAFAGDEAGTRLPDKFGPWRLTDMIPDERVPPHRFSRKDIEHAIRSEGFQLWRLKANAA